VFPCRIVTEWSEEDAAWVARVPALRYCAADGPTPEEAAREVQVAALGMLAELGDKAPAPDAALPSGNIALRMPRSLHAELARRAALEGVSLNQLMVAMLARGLAR
jgi:antitoxin HicB